MGHSLVSLRSLCPSLVLDIRYATSNNFVGKKLYSSAEAFLQLPVALRLQNVQDELIKKGLSLKIWDAYRPLGIQKDLWEIVPDVRYVADPQRGSKHNRGAAVDLTLVDVLGNELAMPTQFDDFSEKAHVSYQDLDPKVVANRELLIQVMMQYGFQPLETEWWHFDDPDWEKYPLESISFEELLNQESL